MTERFSPSGPLRGRVEPPADKSISHRAAIIGAMGSEPVAIDNYLDAADTRATLAAVRQLGAGVEVGPGAEVTIRGCGPAGPDEPAQVLDVGNAGTLMRLLPGWLAGAVGRRFTLDGDESIRRRPMDRIVAPLATMGAAIHARQQRFAPVIVEGRSLRGIEYELPVASAQVKSCLLLAALNADGTTTVMEPLPARDHTERMLRAAGAPVNRAPAPGAGWRTCVGRADVLALGRVRVPGDLSSAAFLIAAAVLVADSRVVVADVGVNWTRAGFLSILRRMGADVHGDVEPPGSFAAAEPRADLKVVSGPLQATDVDGDEVPLAIDELPLVALLGCFAEGETTVRGARELRVKESDRIATVVDGLRGLGADIEAAPDGFAVRGTGGLRGGRLDANGDHRLALLGAVAGLASREGVQVAGMEAASVSYPGFGDDLDALTSPGRNLAW